MRASWEVDKYRRVEIAEEKTINVSFQSFRMSLRERDLDQSVIV